MPPDQLDTLSLVAFCGVPFLLFMAIVVLILRRNRMPPDTRAADRHSLRNRGRDSF